MLKLNCIRHECMIGRNFYHVFYHEAPIKNIFVKPQRVPPFLLDERARPRIPNPRTLRKIMHPNLVETKINSSKNKLTFRLLHLQGLH